MSNAEITAPKQIGRPFVKGQSGNPAGRPKGARNKATIIAEQLLDGEAEALFRKAIELAKGGSENLLKACMDRILPVRRPVEESTTLEIEGAANADTLGIRVIFVKPTPQQDE